MTRERYLNYVTQPTGWPEAVCGIASLLSPSHCPDSSSNNSEHLSSALSLTFSEPLVSKQAPSAGSYTAKDFQVLIQSTAAGLNTLSELPHYGSERSTVPFWSQFLHALANTLSSDVMILYARHAINQDPNIPTAKMHRSSCHELRTWRVSH
ncbi:hypothetical protein BDR04DRAFT_1186888 [Suillus decipiens]|nr:hypothetical protein BDR04DRAFT_1186888 [Suillus decipiens]